jgi:alkylhydroperoxidase/carboxymuconolactone decarboxylase family protein YurZ
MFVGNAADKLELLSTAMFMISRIYRCIEQRWIRQAGGHTMEFSEFSAQKLLQATGQSEHLTDREKHLIGLAVTTTRGCIACTGNRLKRALEAGVSYETLVAGIDVAAAVNAG